MKALVTMALTNEVIIGWQDLMKLKFIAPDFPSASCNEDMVEDLRNKFPKAFCETLPEQPLKGNPMKIHLTEGAKPRCVTRTKATPTHMKAAADETLKKFIDKGVV